MYGGIRHFAASLALHVGIAGTGMALLSGMAHNSEAVMIDLSITDMFSDTCDANKAADDQQPTCPVAPAKPTVAAVRPSKSVQAPPPVPVVENIVSQAQPSPVPALENTPQQVVSETTAPVSSDNKLAAASTASAAVAGGGGSGQANPSQAGSPGGNPAATERLQQLYTKEHFSYIQRIIADKIQYPRVARLSQQEGTVLVSFTISKDGTVSELKIASSSGFALLDKNALEAVNKAAPFPRPPVVAQLRVPIAYSLSNR